MRGGVLLIRDATVVDGSGAAPHTGWSVLVDGRTIAWAGPTEDAPSVEAESTIDGSGCTLLPGLINAHVHLANDGAPDLFAQVRDDSIPLATLRAARNAHLTLESGVTTVRDCGASSEIAIELGRAVADGLIAGPRVQAAGRVITMTGGHGHFMGREADGPVAVRAAVRTELKSGAEFIKVMATGGVLTPRVDPTHPGLHLDELAAAVDEAHSSGRRVTAHAIGSAGIYNALRAGVDSIEHGYHLDEAGLELAVDRGVILVPTLSAIPAIVGQSEGTVAGWVLDKAQRELQRSRDGFTSAVKAGVRIAAGTDAGTPFNRHNHMVGELQLMVELGLSPLEAITAGTSGSAENMDLAHKIGTIAVGMIADLLLVDGDASEDIARLQNVALVVKDGVVVRRPG
jgi:imidazolonepropionase-like amidohydrolase